MRHNYYYLTALFYFFTANGFSQTALPASGIEANGTGGTSSASIGQVHYSHTTGNGGSSEGGVQHAYEISDVSAFHVEDGLEVSVYPNPTTDFINITLDGAGDDALSYYLVNSAGQVVQNGNLNGETTQLSFRDHASAHYLLHIIKNNSIVRTYRVLKTN